MSATFTAGYYNLDIPGLGWAQHTYVVADADGKRVKFPCYGGVDTGKRENGSVYPGDLFTPAIYYYKAEGTTASGNLDVARAIVTGNPRAEHRDDYDRKTGGITGLGDNCGIVYAVTGVCHQMAARILYASQTPVIVWPPTVTATYWRFGFYGISWPAFQLIYDGYKSLLGASAGDAHATLTASVKSHLESGHTAEIRAPHVQGILEARLGREPADLHLPACLEKDQEFAVQKRDLDMQLLRGEITNREFADAANRLFAKLAREIADIVGSDDYTRIFGVAPDVDLTLSIDPEMMPESYGGIL